MLDLVLPDFLTLKTVPKVSSIYRL